MKPTNEDIEIIKVIEALKKEALKPKLDAKIKKERLNRLTWVFNSGHTTPMLMRVYNLQRAIIVETTFNEKTVENPQVREEKLRQYVM